MDKFWLYIPAQNRHWFILCYFCLTKFIISQQLTTNACLAELSMVK